MEPFGLSFPHISKDCWDLGMGGGTRLSEGPSVIKAQLIFKDQLCPSLLWRRIDVVPLKNEMGQDCYERNGM